jgi:hypothetical protein
MAAWLPAYVKVVNHELTPGEGRLAAWYIVLCVVLLRV